MLNWKEYTTQGVKSVDMCAVTIFTHRQKGIPIKAIHLQPRFFEQFAGWAQKKMGRDLLPDEKLQFDEVNIELGDRLQSTPLLIELWAQTKGIA